MHSVVRPILPSVPGKKGKKNNSNLLTVKHWNAKNVQKNVFSANVVIVLPKGGLLTNVPHRCRC